VPAGNRGHFGGAGGNYISLNSQLANDPVKARLAWEVLKFRASKEKHILATREFVNLGQGTYINPQWLRDAGFTSVLEQIPPSLIDGNEKVAKSGYPEPYAPHWNELSSRFLEPAYEHALKDRTANYAREFRDAAFAMNQQWDFDAKDYSKVKGRGASDSWWLRSSCSFADWRFERFAAYRDNTTSVQMNLWSCR